MAVEVSWPVNSVLATYYEGSFFLQICGQKRTLIQAKWQVRARQGIQGIIDKTKMIFLVYFCYSFIFVHCCNYNKFVIALLLIEFWLLVKIYRSNCKRVCVCVFCLIFLIIIILYYNLIFFFIFLFCLNSIVCVRAEIIWICVSFGFTNHRTKTEGKKFIFCLFFIIKKGTLKEKAFKIIFTRPFLEEETELIATKTKSMLDFVWHCFLFLVSVSVLITSVTIVDRLNC